MRWRNSAVLPRNSSSPRVSNCTSSALMRSTTRRYCLSRRSLRLPKIEVKSLGNMDGTHVKALARDSPARAGYEQG